MKNRALQKEARAFQALRAVTGRYYPLSEHSWALLREISYFDTVHKDGVLYPMQEVPKDFGFIYRGLMRQFVFNEAGDEYNKVFFSENTFPGSMVALLTNTPSRFQIVAIEESELVRIDFLGYRKLLQERDDIKLFHIHYLEQNWLIDKESREVSLVQESATERYQRFQENYPNLESRLRQYHIASHLGITPTQLSRIRRNMK
ncbi:Crp/Fnr family transcriptional regulator [Sedimenticola sp.]|uniref:Crp/Fnr family transcriptional regulator n=1 Tax=Sedimenticola sp. TaxID=1940285 RepID=UPI003D10D871